MATRKQILVTGGGTFLGDNIAAALLAEGAEVRLLVRPGAEDRLGSLADRTRWFTADVWDEASLKGRARGQDVVIHTVGSMTADPAHGLTHHRLNFVSARNVANMCVNGGVARMMLISSARAPWVSGQYIAAKREAESYMERVGLEATIVRAPLAYVRGMPRPFFYRLMSMLRFVPPLGLLGFSRISPMPIDVLARGVARLALNDNHTKRIYYAPDLRRLNTRQERRHGAPLTPTEVQVGRRIRPIDQVDENAPFGWTPPRE
jgi:uncharacterized protein YbjT (DUF2867 family)